MDGNVSASSRSVRRGRRPHGTPRNFMHENRETSETPAGKPDGRSAGEGSGRTARVYVCEESHSCVLPMIGFRPRERQFPPRQHQIFWATIRYSLDSSLYVITSNPNCSRRASNSSLVGNGSINRSLVALS